MFHLYVGVNFTLEPGFPIGQVEFIKWKVFCSPL